MPTHAEKRHLPFTPQQMFDLVADIERYPEFLPWCVGTRIRSRDGDTILADMIIGYKMFRERFTSNVTLSAPDRIDVAYSEGPFKYDFYVDFEFRSRVLQKLIGTVFDRAVRIMVHAFEQRAGEIYRNE